MIIIKIKPWETKGRLWGRRVKGVQPRIFPFFAFFSGITLRWWCLWWCCNIMFMMMMTTEVSQIPAKPPSFLSSCISRSINFFSYSLHSLCIEHWGFHLSCQGSCAKNCKHSFTLESWFFSKNLLKFCKMLTNAWIFVTNWERAMKCREMPKGHKLIFFFTRLRFCSLQDVIVQIQMQIQIQM